MAIAGPLSSFGLAGLFYLIYGQGLAANWPLPVNGVIRYLAYINVLLAVFNLLPAFPLDGGRVLRSILWAAWNDLRRATRVSAVIGSAFGIGLIVLGVFSFINGNFIAGLWWFLIGLFIRNAAQMSYQQVLVRKALAGEPVRRFMNPHPVTAPSSITVEQLVEDYIYKYHFKMFPVLDDGKLVGCITTRQVKEVPREKWGEETIGALASRGTHENTISPATDAVKALALMHQSGNSRLLVVEGTKLVGILTLRDLMKFLSLKVELEK
jgi:CBS domain-containing protein